MEVGYQIPVLDQGYVKLVGWMGSDETIIESARMSTGKGFQGWDTDAKLLEYLYKNKHMTPFEMCELAVEVQAPIMVLREWHRHRTQSYSELSARYTQMPDLHYIPSAERLQSSAQDQKNKQGSTAGLDVALAGWIRSGIASDQRALFDQYEGYLKNGVSREVARINTPVSRYSRMRAKTDLRNWLGFLLLRKAPAAQWEIRQYADAVGSIVEALWPRTYALFLEWDLHGVHLSRSEADALAMYFSELERSLPPELHEAVSRVRRKST